MSRYIWDEEGKYWTIDENSRWIPAKEALPPMPVGSADYFLDGEDIPADEYIVMIKDAKIPTALHWTGSAWMDLNTDEDFSYEVVAWMPMPMPYKVDHEDI